MPGDAAGVDPGDEVLGGEARQRRAGEIGIGGEEVLGADEAVGEVAPPAARDLDLSADPRLALEDDDAASPPRRLGRTEEAGRASAEDRDVEVYFSISSSSTSKTSAAPGLISGGAPRSL